MQHNRNNAIQTRRTQENNAVHLNMKQIKCTSVGNLSSTAMTTTCNAIILYWVPNSFQVRTSKTVLQIILKFDDIPWSSNLCIMCYIHHLILSLLQFFFCRFIFIGAQVNLHWKDVPLRWLIQPKGKKITQKPQKTTKTKQTKKSQKPHNTQN